MHKQFSPLFDASYPEELKARQRERIGARLEWVAQQLGNKPYLMGETFTVADAYLFTVINWGQWVGIDIGKWPAIAAFHQRATARPKVQDALKAEGLIK